MRKQHGNSLIKTNIKNDTLLFAVSLLFRSSDNGKFTEESLWEESIVLIRALSEDEAEKKASAIGLSAQHSYVAIDGTFVEWSFYKVESVFQIIDQPLRVGSEIFSRFLKDFQVQGLLTSFGES